MNRKLHLIKNILFSNFKRLESPYKMTFALTYKCNLSCKICKIWERESIDELSVDEIIKIFRNLRNLSWLDLTGGEITLREDLLLIARAVMKHAKNLSVFHISTNGQLSRKAYLLVREILKNGLTPVVNVSIDGPKNINDELRGKRGAYENSIETFLKLKSLKKGHYFISSTLSSYNILHLAELISGFKRDISGFSCSDLHFNIFHNSAHYYQNSQIGGLPDLTMEELKKYFVLSRKGSLLKFIFEDRYLKGLFKYFQGDRFPMECHALKSCCFMDPCGVIYPCGIYNNAVGDLRSRDYNLNTLWQSPEALGTRSSIDQEKCPGCWSPCEAYPSILGNLFKNGE